MQLEVREVILGEDERWGMNIISLTDDPANMEETIKLSKQIEDIQMASDEERQMLYGAALIPEQKILRVPKDGSPPYYLVFSADTIRQIAYRWAANGYNTNVDMEHSGDLLDGVNVVESWFVDYPMQDKSTAMGMKLNEGTWALGVHVNKPKLWTKLRDSKTLGFSVTGLMQSQKIEMSKDEKLVNDLLEVMSQPDMVGKLLSVLDIDA